MKKILCLLLIVMSLSTSIVYAYDISPLRRGEPCPTPGCLGSVFKVIVWRPNADAVSGPHGSCHITVPHTYKWEEKWITWHCDSCGFLSEYNTYEGRNYRCVIN